MEYIKVEDNVITEIVSCSEPPGDQWHKVDLSGGIAVGDDVRAFDENWKLRPLDELIAESLIEVKNDSEFSFDYDKSSNVRSERDRLLIQMDRVISNPLRWNAMSEALQQQYAKYRQALLDVPQQTGFPENVAWPEPPE